MRRSRMIWMIVILLAATMVAPALGGAGGQALAADVDWEATYVKVAQAIEDYAAPYTGKNALTNYNGKARQCHAFVNYIWKNVFGYDLYSGKSSTTPKSTDYAAMGNYVNTYGRPGDILRVEGEHSMVITSIGPDSVTGYDWLYTTKEAKRTYTWAQVKKWGNGSQPYFLYQMDDEVYKARYGVSWTAPAPESGLEGSVIALQIGNPLMSVNGIGLPIDSAGTSPMVVGGRTLIPARAVVEAMGGEIGWDPASQTATLDRVEHSLRLTAGSYVMTVNGEEHSLDAAPALVGGRLMVPLRSVVEALGARVLWKQETRTITIVM